MSPADLEFRPLQPSDDCGRIVIGDQQFISLKEFIENNALNHQEQSLSQTCVLADKNRVLAFVTLVCSEIRTKKVLNRLPLTKEDYEYPTIGAVRLAALLVDASNRNSGLGQQLLDYAIYVSLDLSKQIGCRFVAVDSAPNKRTIKFYRRNGFEYVDTNMCDAQLDKFKSKNQTVSMVLDLSKGH